MSSLHHNNLVCFETCQVGSSPIADSMKSETYLYQCMPAVWNIQSVGCFLSNTNYHYFMQAVLTFCSRVDYEQLVSCTVWCTCVVTGLMCFPRVLFFTATIYYLCLMETSFNLCSGAWNPCGWDWVINCACVYNTVNIVYSAGSNSVKPDYRYYSELAGKPFLPTQDIVQGQIHRW